MFLHILYDGHYSKLRAHNGDSNRKSPCPQISQHGVEGDKCYDGVRWGLNGDEHGVQGATEDLEETYTPLVGNLKWEWILLNKTIWITFPSKWLILYFQVVEKLNGKAHGSVMVLVTSGDDEHVANCLLTVQSSGSTIHTIALGSSAVENLEELSHLTGKYISKNLYFRAFPINLNIQSTTMKLRLCQQNTGLNWKK